jgi:hypothetical protein
MIAQSADKTKQIDVSINDMIEFVIGAIAVPKGQ